MSADFKIKAIETHYNNYRFRSRLEARHAVFMDALGVKYLYEHEGYDIEGTRYLPDFLLPDHNCFIEIKGQEPTEDELQKIKLLALYTGKDVHIFYGEIGRPKENKKGGAVSYGPPQLWRYLKSEGLGQTGTHRPQVAHDLLILWQKLDAAGLQLEMDEDGDVVFIPYEYPYQLHEVANYLQNLRDQQSALEMLQSILETREEEIIQLLTVEEGWRQDFFEQQEIHAQTWHECQNCGGFEVHGSYDGATHICEDKKLGHLFSDTPRLLNAYKAARQARFEFGR